MSHMINAGQIKQDGEESIILNAVGGVQRFGVNEGLQEIIPHEEDGNDQLQDEQVDGNWAEPFFNFKNLNFFNFSF